MAEDFLFDVSESLSGRFWSLKEAEEAAVRALSLKAGVSDILARLLVTRGVDPETAESFLRPTLRELF
ncbi:MAG: single-stranded-DNA-specific exonuclease RecJ, partial [Henriciella sp.]